MVTIDHSKGAASDIQMIPFGPLVAPLGLSPETPLGLKAYVPYLTSELRQIKLKDNLPGVINKQTIAS